MIDTLYSKEKKFKYIRYNSLPAFADYIIDYDKYYYAGWGVDVCHNKEIGIDVSKIKPYNSVFIKTDLLENSLDILDKIKVPYHLLTGVSDKFVEKTLIDKVLNTKIVSWIGNNLEKVNDRFLQVPIGFSEEGQQRTNTITEYIELCDQKIIDLVITPFTETHGERKELSNLNGKNILNLSNKLDYTKYLTILGISKYSCCPRGNGYDSIRVSESILMNSVPVVKSSPLDPLYTEMNAVIIKNWEDIKKFDFSKTKTLNRDVLTFEYWETRIKNHQGVYEKNYC